MKRKSFTVMVLLALLFCLPHLTYAQAKTDAKKPANPKTDKKPETKATVDNTQAMLLKAVDNISKVRVYVEFFFMESGDYPENLEKLETELNSLLPAGLQKVEIPKDPATGKDFYYKLSEDCKTYKLGVPEPSRYGLKALELDSVSWGGFAQIATERKNKFIQMISMENIKAIATAVEYFAKDNEGKLPEKLKDLIPNYLKSMPVCPVTKEFYSYKVSGDDYSIGAPDPSIYGMKQLMYSSERGWVTQ